MHGHKRGLDGRTVERAKHRQSGDQRLGWRRGRGLRGARVQASLSRRTGWEDGQVDSPNRAKIGSFYLILAHTN